MARASSGVSHAQLSWANAWYLRPETYADALARIIDAHHALPFARVWGSAGRTSSDGQFFPSGRNAGEINAKYGPDPGLKIYSFLSGSYGSFHSNVIGATAGEAPFVLDGLGPSGAGLQIRGRLSMRANRALWQGAGRSPPAAASRSRPI